LTQNEFCSTLPGNKSLANLEAIRTICKGQLIMKIVDIPAMMAMHDLHLFTANELRGAKDELEMVYSPTW
jgi:hypothetical protein